MNTIQIMQESRLISLNSTTIILQKVPNQRQPCVSLPIIRLQCQTLFEIYLGFFVTLQVTHCRRSIGEINVRIGPSGTDLQRVCVQLDGFVVFILGHLAVAFILETVGFSLFCCDLTSKLFRNVEPTGDGIL